MDIPQDDINQLSSHIEAKAEPKPDEPISNKPDKLAYYRKFTDSRLTTASILAFFPATGVLGVHNFALKQYVKGLLHIAIFVAAYLPSIITSLSCKGNYEDGCVVATLIAQYCSYFVAGSYIWAVIEGSNIINAKGLNCASFKAPSSPPQSDNSPQETTNSLSTSSSATKTHLDAASGETTYITASPMSPEQKERVEQEIKQERRRESMPVYSILATILPIFLWAYCLIVSGGETSENGKGAVFWLLIMYYWSIGIPALCASIICGVIGLKSSLKWLSILSLTIKAITIIVIILVVFTPIFRQ